jgi:transposase
MRGEAERQIGMLTLVTPEQRVRDDHPLQRVKPLADAAMKDLSPIFEKMYSRTGRPSIPPERLLKATLLMAFYTVRSERLFCEQLDYNLLFRWFLDMGLDEPSFDHSSFTRNRARLLEHDVAREFFGRIVAQAQGLGLMSDEHFTVDGTLIEAWASLKSFKPKDGSNDHPPDDPGNPTVDFHGERRSNATHESTTDPEARLAKKGAGKEAKLCYSGHALMENRNGMLVDFQIAQANGRAERRAAIEMVEQNLPGTSRITLGADKAYDTADFVATCRALNITPHVAANDGRRGGSALDGRTLRHAGYLISQQKRKRVEEIFGWIKTIANFRRTRYRGRELTQLAAYLVGAAYNLMRIARLTVQLSKVTDERQPRGRNHVNF